MNKTVLISGGATGIGKACAYEFSKLKYNIAIIYNTSKNEANSLKNEIINSGCDCECFECNLTDFNAVENTVSTVIKRFGRIDILVNNAGISEQKLFTDITKADWDKMINTNLNSVFNLTHAVVPNMLSRHKGRIINISSMWGEVGASCEVHYSAAKAAVNGFTKALAKELAPSGILVNALSPGVIDTKMNDHLSDEDKRNLAEEIPLGRFGTPEEIAKAVVFLASSGASYITGQILGVNGGLIV